MEILVLLLVVIIIGALLGGKSFGGTVRKGFGFFLWLVIIAIAVVVFFYSQTDSEKADSEKADSEKADSEKTDSEKTADEQEVISTSDNLTYLIVKENVQTYIKPNVESDVSGNLEIGKEFFVEDINKFNYFYEITNKNGKKAFVMKEFLKRK